MIPGMSYTRLPMTWAVAGTLTACLIVPAVWGWLVEAAFRTLRLDRYFPLGNPQARPGVPPWDYQI